MIIINFFKLLFIFFFAYLIISLVKFVFYFRKNLKMNIKNMQDKQDKQHDNVQDRHQDNIHEESHFNQDTGKRGSVIKLDKDEYKVE